MPSIDDIAAEYVERAAVLDPCYATCAGIAGHDHELTDLGADGFAGRAGLDRSTLAALDAAKAQEPREQAARAAMRERLAVAVERYDAGDTTSELNTINSWVQEVRKVFDLMPTDGEEAAASIAGGWPRCRGLTASCPRPCSQRPGMAAARPGGRSKRWPGSARLGPDRGIPSTQDWPGG